MTSKITISLPDNLREKLEEKIKETDFKSIEDYILYVLKQMVSVDSKEKVTYSDEDEAALKKKLKEMGYL
ncbi:MAG: CopG family transcriptional regulator [Nanoarchaeota archaeon]|nr:CopG family transcriptional regulator [Nanoarchaeota archaeon]